MPPHCPIRYYARCGERRPCVDVDGEPHCIDCNPWADSDGKLVAADGGESGR